MYVLKFWVVTKTIASGSDVYEKFLVKINFGMQNFVNI